MRHLQGLSSDSALAEDAIPFDVQQVDACQVSLSC